jgi:ABC-type branched-subunit amino acid transport system ATPase component
MGNSLKIEGLTRSFGTVTALDDFTLTTAGTHAALI